MATEIKIDRDRYLEQSKMIRWCYDEYGGWAIRNGLERWGVNQLNGVAYFSFKNEEDAVLFLLRWS